MSCLLTRAFLPVVFLPALFLLAACASYQPDRGLDSVNQSLADRGVGSIARVAGDQLNTPAFDGLVTPDAAARSALQYNALLQAGLEDLNLADAEQVQAGLLINPTLNSEIIFEGGGEPVEYTFALGLNLSRLLTRGWRMRTAKAEREAVEQATIRLITATIMDARMAVVNLWVAEQMLAVARDIRITRQAAVDVAEELARVGNLDQGRLARAEALLARAELDAAMAELRLLDAQQALANTTGRPLGLDAHADLGAMPPRPDDKATFVKAALDASLSLAEARAGMQALAERLGLAEVEVWLDHIEAGAVAEREEGSWGEGFELSLPIPVFDLGSTRAGAASAQLKAAEYRYKALYLAVGNRAAALFEAAARLEVIDQQSATRLQLRAEGDYAFDQQRFNAMQIGPMMLLDAKINRLLARQAALAVRQQRLATVYESMALNAGVMMNRPRQTGLTMGPGAEPEGDH